MFHRNIVWIALVITLSVQTLIAQSVTGYWPWVSAGLLGVVMFWCIQQETRAMPGNIRSQTIDRIIQRLPPSLSIGTQTPSDVLQRVLQVWEEFETMTLILDRILEGVVMVSSDGDILLMNQRAVELLEVREEQHVEKLMLHKKGMKLIRQTLSGIEGEVTWYHREKPHRQYFEMVGLPLDHGGAIFVVRDITKIRHLERVRRDFIANISHELRTPITTILMNVEALMDESIDDRFVNAIHRNADRLSLLVNGLLDLSRIESGDVELTLQQLELLPLVDRVCGALDSLVQKKQQRLEVDIPDGCLAVVDVQAIEQILTNLVSNAIKYAPTTSVIVIRTRLQGEHLVIEVEDNGQGISLKHQKRLFERFYRVDKGRSRDEGGTGLGLAIVRHLVEAMGGEVGVRSAKPHGSIFWVRLNASTE